MDTDRPNIADEQKFKEHFDLENDSDLEIEDKFDMYDQYFPTPAKAKAYNDWRKARKAQDSKVQDSKAQDSKASEGTAAAAAAAGNAKRVDDEPHALHIYREQLRTADFKNVNRVSVLNELLNGGLHPHIPIGHTKGHAFRLVPNTRILRPTKKTNWDFTSDLTVVPNMVLGLNHGVRLNEVIDWAAEERAAVIRYIDDYDSDTSDEEDYSGLSQAALYIKLAKKVCRLSTDDRPFGKYGRPEPNLKQSDSSYAASSNSVERWHGHVAPTEDTSAPIDRDRRRQMRSDRSGDSTTANDSSGFAFYQLGALHYCDTLADPTTTDLDKVFAEEWTSTEYVLVAKIDTFGHLADIWVLWDFWADPDNDGVRRWLLPQKFPGTDDSITAAKIADSFADLGADRPIRFPVSEPERFEEDFELVGCFRTTDGKIVRQWVV